MDESEVSGSSIVIPKDDSINKTDENNQSINQNLYLQPNKIIRFTYNFNTATKRRP